MFSIQRKQFLNLRWTSHDLNSVAAFWAKQIQHETGSRRPSRAYLQIHIAGLPKAARPEFIAKLERRIETFNPRAKIVTEQGILTVALDLDMSDRLPEGMGLEWFDSPECNGLALVIRWRVGGFVQLTRESLAIVVAGQIEEGVLHVKAVWTNQNPGDDHEFFGLEFRGEDRLLDAFERFLSDGTIKNLPGACLPPQPSTVPVPAVVYVLITVQNLLYVPEGGPRLKGLLIRIAFLLLLCGGSIVGWFISVPPRLEDTKEMLMVSACLISCYLIGAFVVHERKIALKYIAWLKTHRTVYPDGVKFAMQDEGFTEKLSRDPAVWKQTQDLLAAGFRLAGDVTSNTDEWLPVYRIFYAPDGVGYFILLFMNRVLVEGAMCRRWPAGTDCHHAQTFFSSGGRTESFQSNYLYRPFPPARGTLIRISDVKKLLDYYESHRAAAEKFASSESLTVVRHESLERFVERQQRIYDEEKEHARNLRYSLKDHLRWYLQMPKREFRFPA